MSKTCVHFASSTLKKHISKCLSPSFPSLQSTLSYFFFRTFSLSLDSFLSQEKRLPRCSPHRTKVTTPTYRRPDSALRRYISIVLIIQGIYIISTKGFSQLELLSPPGVRASFTRL